MQEKFNQTHAAMRLYSIVQYTGLLIENKVLFMRFTTGKIKVKIDVNLNHTPSMEVPFIQSD